MRSLSHEEFFISHPEGVKGKLCSHMTWHYARPRLLAAVRLTSVLLKGTGPAHRRENRSNKSFSSCLWSSIADRDCQVTHAAHTISLWLLTPVSRGTTVRYCPWEYTHRKHVTASKDAVEKRGECGGGEEQSKW